LWTANNRVLGSADYWRLGPWTADLGARARQIRDGLLALKPASVTEHDLLGIQLDDRALFLDRWQQRLKRVLLSPPLAERGDLDELRSLVEHWGARAAVDSVGYRLVREFRLRVARLLFEPVEDRCQQAVPDFRVWWHQQEGPLWALLEQQPRHLLNPRFENYDALLAAAVDQMVSDYRARGVALTEATWGQRNRVHVQHPISRAVPQLSRWLDIPPTPLPGDSNMPRVQSPGDGASERMVVSPGHEESGLFHMPAGQSGHFLSPFYRAGHDAWAKGEPTPFLPGPAVHRLILKPTAADGV
jgi:penicillin amidase